MKADSLKKRSLGIVTMFSRVAVAICFCQALTVKSLPVSLGAAGDYAVLEIGNGNVSLATGGGTGYINGNLGAVGGNVSDGGSFPINGNVYLGSGATSSGLSGNVSGTIHTGYNLNQAVSDAITASSQAAKLGSIGGGTGYSSITAGATLTPGVYNLTDLNLPNNAVLTLGGGGVGYYVFNITGTLALHSSEILLGSGMTADQVLFNVIGNTAVAFSGGLNNESILNGIILATNAQVHVSPGLVNGEIIAGDSINISSGGSVNGITKVPDAASTAALLGLALAGLGGLRRKFCSV